MENPTKEYTEEHICRHFLDNADMYIIYNPHNNYLVLVFIVFGQVDGKYWKIKIHCDGLYHFSVSKHSIENINKIERYE